MPENTSLNVLCSANPRTIAVASGGVLRGSCRQLIGPHPENALCRLVLSHHHGFHVAVAQRTAGCSAPASSAVCAALTPALPHLIKSAGEMVSVTSPASPSPKRNHPCASEAILSVRWIREVRNRSRRQRSRRTEYSAGDRGASPARV